MNPLMIAGLTALAALSSASRSYDPLATSKTHAATAHDLVVKDSARTRSIPVLVYLPETTNAAPVILFSHGLGGSRTGSAYLGKHWSARGYVAAFVQHPGSDDSVWKNTAHRDRMNSLEKAASSNNYLLRVKDIPAVLDQLEKWNTEKGHVLQGRLDLKHVGMSGHSFGAVTTQAVSGQSAGGRISYTDTRIKAACAFSPSSPRMGKPEKVFGKVAIPWMLMTGTKDVSLIGKADVESRLAVYPALPSGGKYELVLHNAEHSAFSERALPGDTEKRNPNHHRAILALSTAFWDAYLLDDASAKAWLDGNGPRSVLETKDRWQRK